MDRIGSLCDQHIQVKKMIRVESGRIKKDSEMMLTRLINAPR
jgi:hypothetical protein